MRRLTWIALTLLLAGGAVLLLRQTVGTTFWFDEWAWVVDRRGGGVDTFLQPHNEHLSLVPVALYKLLFATAGLEHYAPYRVMVTAAHLLVVTLLFVYARRRAGDLVALAAAALLLLLGPAWQNILWPFQVGTLLSLAAGVGALLALDREDRRGDVLACALLAFALASSGLGLPVVIGVGVEILWRRRWAGLWIVGVPVLLYGMWWLGYQQTEEIPDNLGRTPRYVVDAAASALSAVAGLAARPLGDQGPTLDWGRPLLAVAAAAVAWRLWRMRPVPARVVALLAMVLSFWLLTGLRRAHVSAPWESRYLYVSALLLLLLAVDLLRGVRFPRPVLAVGAIAVAAILVANFADMRAGGRYLRAHGPQTRAVLAGVEITRAQAQPDRVIRGLPGYPFVSMRVGEYLAAVDELGSPAMSVAELENAREGPQKGADAEMAAALEIRPQAGGRACGERIVPPDGLALSGPGEVFVRRFADTYPAQPRAQITGPARLDVPADGVDVPWRVKVEPCAGGGAAR